MSLVCHDFYRCEIHSLIKITFLEDTLRLSLAVFMPTSARRACAAARPSSALTRNSGGRRLNARVSVYVYSAAGTWVYQESACGDNALACIHV